MIVESEVWGVGTIAPRVQTFVKLSVEYNSKDEGKLVRAQFQGRYRGDVSVFKKPKLQEGRVVKIRVNPKNPKVIALEMDNPSR